VQLIESASCGPLSSQLHSSDEGYSPLPEAACAPVCSL